MYRPPIKTPRKFLPKLPNVPEVSKTVTDLFEISKILSELSAVKNQFSEAIESAVNQIETAKKNSLIVDDLIQDVKDRLSQISVMKKGDKGDIGDTGNAAVVDYDRIITTVLDKIPRPKNGEDAVVDYQKVVREVLSRIHIPVPKPGKPGNDAVVDYERIFEVLASKIKEKKIKLSVGDIDGYQDAESVVRRFLARGSIRGGGDTVEAGTNVTITTVAGKKRISAAGGAGFTELTATGTINGTNTAFTFTEQPDYVVADGVWYKSGDAWSWNGSDTVTMTIPPAFSIFGVT